MNHEASAIIAFIKDQFSVEIDLSMMVNHLSNLLKLQAESLSNQFINIAPHNDYDLLIEDKETIISFLKEEAVKPEYWVLMQAVGDFISEQYVCNFTFHCKEVDQGNNLKGIVSFSPLTKDIKHAFFLVEN